MLPEDIVIDMLRASFTNVDAVHYLGVFYRRSQMEGMPTAVITIFRMAEVVYESAKIGYVLHP